LLSANMRPSGAIEMIFPSTAHAAVVDAATNDVAAERGRSADRSANGWRPGAAGASMA
jgi:hypothetical protein